MTGRGGCGRRPVVPSGSAGAVSPRTRRTGRAEPAVAFDGEGHGEALGCGSSIDSGRFRVALRVVRSSELLGRVASVDADSYTSGEKRVVRARRGCGRTAAGVDEEVDGEVVAVGGAGGDESVAAVASRSRPAMMVSPRMVTWTSPRRAAADRPFEERARTSPGRAGTMGARATPPPLVPVHVGGEVDLDCTAGVGSSTIPGIQPSRNEVRRRGGGGDGGTGAPGFATSGRRGGCHGRRR